jgi:hypothetical protein
VINDVRILLTDGSYIHLSECLHIEYIPDAGCPSTVEFVCSYCVIKLGYNRIECIRPDWTKNLVKE